MIDLSDIKPRAIIRQYFNPDNVNNGLIHIIAIVDEDQIVFKMWSKWRKRWNYQVEHILFFEVRKEYLSVEKNGNEESNSELVDIFGAIELVYGGSAHLQSSGPPGLSHGKKFLFKLVKKDDDQ